MSNDGCIVRDLDALIRAGKTFAVIYADPPWRFRTWTTTDQQKSASRYYDLMDTSEISALPINALAADDCVLLMWSISPMLPDALKVIAAWGFTFKTVAFVWVKQNANKFGLKWGLGYWTRANAEYCLLATRGMPKRQAMDVHQVIIAPASAHSRKPDEAQIRIERLLEGPYLELYGRRATAGWTVWGNDINRDLLTNSIPEFLG